MIFRKFPSQYRALHDVGRCCAKSKVKIEGSFTVRNVVNQLKLEEDQRKSKFRSFKA